MVFLVAAVGILEKSQVAPKLLVSNVFQKIRHAIVMQKTLYRGEALWLCLRSSWATSSFGDSFIARQKETNGCLAGLYLSAISKELMELLGWNLRVMLLFIHITGLCLNIVMILVICFQLLTMLDRQLLKINLHKHDISFAQLIRFAHMLMLRGHQALFVTSLSVPMGMTSLPSADHYVLRL